MAKSLRSKVKRAVRAERRVALAKSPVEAKRQGNRDAAMAKILETAALKREQAKLHGAMDVEPSSMLAAGSAAGNANANAANAKTALDNARTTDEVSWSKIGIRAGGVNAKSLRYTTRSRGKCRGPRKILEVGSAARSHGGTGKANSKPSSSSEQPSKTAFLFPVNPKNKKRRRTNIFTRHG